MSDILDAIARREVLSNYEALGQLKAAQHLRQLLEDHQMRAGLDAWLSGRWLRLSAEAWQAEGEAQKLLAVQASEVRSVPQLLDKFVRDVELTAKDAVHRRQERVNQEEDHGS